MHNIFSIQSDDYTMCWFYCIAIIEYMPVRNNDLFFPNDYEKNEKII